MTAAHVLAELKEMGDPRAIAVWQKLGMNPDSYYGVNLTKLKTYAAKLKKNHDLALELWQSGIHDARLLATYIADPKLVTESLVDEWIKDADFWDLSDKLCANIVARTPFGVKKAAAWAKSKQEFVKRSGFIIVAELAKHSKTTTDADFMPFLDAIEQEIQKSPNWAKEGMNTALMYVGKRSPALRNRALAVLDKVGPIEVDYGDTSCKTPDARAYLGVAAAKATK